jgi:hypothetical protein
MPRRRNETNQQWMDRVRAARGLPPMDRDRLMHDLRAAKCYIGSIQSPERQAEVELAAFMHFFHPRPEGYTRLDAARMLK